MTNSETNKNVEIKILFVNHGKYLCPIYMKSIQNYKKAIHYSHNFMQFYRAMFGLPGFDKSFNIKDQTTPQLFLFSKVLRHREQGHFGAMGVYRQRSCQEITKLNLLHSLVC